MAGRMIRTAWSTLQAEEREEVRQRVMNTEPRLTAREVERRIDGMPLRYGRMCPRIKAVTARKNKRLRADPIAQQWIEDRVRTAVYLPEVEEEWATWQEGASDSPGRIDASTYLAYALLPIPKSGSGGAAAPGGSLPTTGSSPLDRGGTGGGFGPLAR